MKNIVLKKLLKRIFDIIIAGITLVVMLPFLLIVFISIKLSDKGPIFYKNKRIGLNGKAFIYYKFRTMYLDADVQKIIPSMPIMKDHRITPIGKFIRKTSIDELPALFNVLKGDMSIVGPRPQFLLFVDRLSKEQQELLFSIKPGITGLSQIERYKKALDFNDMLKIDLWYINNWSFYLDLKIIFFTAFMDFKGKSAY